MRMSTVSVTAAQDYGTASVTSVPRHHHYVGDADYYGTASDTSVPRQHYVGDADYYGTASVTTDEYDEEQAVLPRHHYVVDAEDCVTAQIKKTREALDE